MSIYDPPETYTGKLPSKYQIGDKVTWREEKATIAAVEFHDGTGNVMYLVRPEDPDHGGMWCDSNGVQKR